MVWIVFSIIIFLIFIFLLFILFVAYKLITPSRFVGNWTPKNFGAEYKEIELVTEDNLRLKGWEILGGDKCVIVLHGYSRSRWDEVYMKKITKILWKDGYSVITFDFRAHGESEGKHTTLGDREFMDVKSAVDYARKRYSNVFIIGYSMGGFLALKAAGYGLVDKAVADSPYIYTDRTGARGLKYFANLPEWLYVFVKPFAILISGVKFENTNPFIFAKNIKIPVLIIAGKKDPLVKVEEVKEFVNFAGENVSLWITEGAHVRSIEIDEERYKEKILKFLSQ